MQKISIFLLASLTLFTSSCSLYQAANPFYHDDICTHDNVKNAFITKFNDLVGHVDQNIKAIGIAKSNETHMEVSCDVSLQLNNGEIINDKFGIDSVNGWYFILDNKHKLSEIEQKIYNYQYQAYQTNRNIYNNERSKRVKQFLDEPVEYRATYCEKILNMKLNQGVYINSSNEFINQCIYTGNQIY
ncbi:hypothetical protein [Ferrovum sp. PN-J185]|uniref:hypothetical protein n=1 Tax=Ferrovum sp. PN-J185 TaxID=1356306 RepID=UPI000791CC9D|nr:hypothetical protein [Ferrovum sp. PN-J185]KXW55479.1 hypothetical protein FV185_12460 [Ferrovum sp. PN-J185]